MHLVINVKEKLCNNRKRCEKYKKFQGNRALVLLGGCQSFHSMNVTNCNCSNLFLVSTVSNKLRNAKADLNCKSYTTSNEITAKFMVFGFSFFLFL